ncbi:ABC transporter substrate-binding protein [Occultella kanbiaonis]|uniref:ABC transporter substrate-binding protein n=1 Tax=Occultella kanbiaonis TaxID=2675754 RepID=UPI0013D5E8F9|nr:sugar ABC transporter substrate-binding protein [Occultella kanbiaonis]
MRRSTVVTAWAGTAVLALSLAACGGDSGGDQSPDTLQVMMSPHSITDVITERLGEFEEESGIDVEITSLNEDQVSQQLRVEFGANNSATDVFLYRPLQDTAQFVNNGWIADLTDRVTGDAEFDWEDFGEPTREAVTSTEGNVIAVPVATARQMLFYRADLLAEAGVEVPTTLEELEAAAAQLDTPDVAGICLRGQRAQAVTTFAQFLYAFGGNWNEGGEPYGDATVDSPEAIEAFEYYGNLLSNYGPAGVLNMSWAECSALFSQGRAAMYIEGDDRWPEFTDPEKSTLTEAQVGYAPSPALTSVVPAQAFGIAASSDNTDGAWEFIRWATSVEMAADMQEVGVMGARDSAWESEQTAERFPEAVVAAVQVGNATGIPYDRPRIVAVGEARDAIGGALVAAIEGGDVADAAGTANEAFQQLIDSEKSQFGIE